MKIIWIAVVFVMFSGPCHLRERADKEGALMLVKSIRDAEVAHKRKFNRYGTLAELIAEDLLSEVLSDGHDSGHSFVLIADQSTYRLTVQRVFTHGQIPRAEEISYFLDQTGVIRGAVKASEVANASSPPLYPAESGHR